MIEYAELKPVPGSDVLQISSTLKKNSLLDQAPENTIVVDPSSILDGTSRREWFIDYAYYDRGNGLRMPLMVRFAGSTKKRLRHYIKQPVKPKQVKQVTHPRHDYERNLIMT